MLYFIPYEAWTMLCENNLFVTVIVEVAGNFSVKIWKKNDKKLVCIWGWVRVFNSFRGTGQMLMHKKIMFYRYYCKKTNCDTWKF